MWNPETYRDTDYGLTDDETFEPGDDYEEEYVPDEGDPYVMTVLGPIHPDEVGVALVREHLQWTPPNDAGGIDERLHEVTAALGDLEAFFTVSGRTVVSATPPGAGRDARALRLLAQHAPVHIVAATGFAGEAWAEGVTAAGVRVRIEADLAEGMDGTDARPGILVAASSGDEITSLEAAAVEAIGAAHASAGLPVLAIAAGNAQRGMVERIEAAGVPRDRIIVGGAGELPDADLDALAESGAWLLFDGLGSDEGEADGARAQRVARLVEQGYLDRILLSHAYRRRSLLTGYHGRPGLAYIVEQFAVILLEEGLEALDVRRMLVDNAVAALTIIATVSGAGRTHREG